MDLLEIISGSSQSISNKANSMNTAISGAAEKAATGISKFESSIESLSSTLSGGVNSFLKKATKDVEVKTQVGLSPVTIGVILLAVYFIFVKKKKR